MTNALQKIPTPLQQELTGCSLRVQNNAAAIYDLLDRKGGAVKVEAIKKELNIGPEEYRSARKLLMMTSAGVYVTQDGVILKKYLSTEEQRYWHLAWSLGLFEVSGKQLTLDEDLLQKVPRAVYTLISQGKLTDHKRVSALRIRAKQAIGILMEVANMYRQVDKALGLVLLPEVSGKVWDKTLREIKKQLKTIE
jgi:ribosomal protein L31E